VSIVRGSPIYDDYLQSVKFIFPSLYRFPPPLLRGLLMDEARVVGLAVAKTRAPR